jgi:hypothetical protein
MPYLLCLLAIAIPVLIVQVRWAIHRRQLMWQSWDTLLDRVERVDLNGIRAIADCYLQPDRDQLRIEPNEMWALLGGLEGVNRLRRNAAVMLDLAVYAQRWNDTEGAVISEMIRRDSIRLNRAVTRIQLTFFFGLGFVRAPFHVQEAAASYYLIRSRLLGVYQNSHIALVLRLEAAL